MLQRWKLEERSSVATPDAKDTPADVLREIQKVMYKGGNWPQNATFRGAVSAPLLWGERCSTPNPPTHLRMRLRRVYYSLIGSNQKGRSTRI